MQVVGIRFLGDSHSPNTLSLRGRSFAGGVRTSDHYGIVVFPVYFTELGVYGFTGVSDVVVVWILCFLEDDQLLGQFENVLREFLPSAN